VHISVDTGSLSSDFLTNTASQTISGTLNTGLAVGEVLYGSTDNGATWTDIHTSVSGTSISWAGATLHTGADHILFKVSDSLGFDSASTGSTAYTLDTVAPTASTSTTSIANSANAVVQSTEVGTAYLVSDSITVNSLADITGAVDAAWNSVAISTANSNTNLAATGLAAGGYHVYTVDAAGNLSQQSGSGITVSAAPSTYDHVILTLYGGAGGAPYPAAVIDVNGDGRLTAADEDPNTAGSYIYADFTPVYGNVDLAGTAVTITYYTTLYFGSLNLTGFGADDKIRIDLAEFYNIQAGTYAYLFGTTANLGAAFKQANLQATAGGKVTGTYKNISTGKGAFSHYSGSPYMQLTYNAGTQPGLFRVMHAGTELRLTTKQPGYITNTRLLANHLPAASSFSIPTFVFSQVDFVHPV
jgi:hypothetical protein